MPKLFLSRSPAKTTAEAESPRGWTCTRPFMRKVPDGINKGLEKYLSDGFHLTDVGHQTGAHVFSLLVFRTNYELRIDAPKQVATTEILKTIDKQIPELPADRLLSAFPDWRCVHVPRALLLVLLRNSRLRMQ